MLDRVERAAVRRQKELLEPVVEELLHPLRLVDAQVVHHDRHLALDLLFQSDDEVVEGVGVVAAVKYLVVCESIALRYGSDYAARAASVARYLDGHIALHPEPGGH